VGASLASLGTFFHVRGHLPSHDYQQARLCYHEAIRIWEGLKEGKESPAREARLLNAWLSMDLEDYSLAEAQFGELIRRSTTLGKADRFLVRAHMGLLAARVERAAAGQSFPVTALIPVLELALQMQTIDHDRSWSQAFKSFRHAWIAGQFGLASASERQFRACREHIRGSHPEGHYYEVFPLFFLAESLAHRGEKKQAALVYQECLEMLEKTVGLEHLKAGYLIGRYARALIALGELRKAHCLFARLSREVASRYGADHWHHANALMEYADFLHEIRDWPRMEQICRQADAIYEQTGGNQRKLYQHCKRRLALALQRRGK
jgi:hypothetical protein